MAWNEKELLYLILPGKAFQHRGVWKWILDLPWRPVSIWGQAERQNLMIADDKSRIKHGRWLRVQSLWFMLEPYHRRKKIEVII